MASIVGILLPVLLGFTAMSLDIGWWYGDLQSEQMTANAAALAGARALSYGMAASDTTAMQAVVNQAASTASSINESSKLTETIQQDQASSASGQVTILSSNPGPLFLSRIFLSASPKISSQAVATETQQSSGMTEVYLSGL
jgi:Flp pilus assembly protein TadG